MVTLGQGWARVTRLGIAFSSAIAIRTVETFDKQKLILTFWSEFFQGYNNTYVNTYCDSNTYTIKNKLRFLIIKLYIVLEKCQKLNTNTGTLHGIKDLIKLIFLLGLCPFPANFCRYFNISKNICIFITDKSQSVEAFIQCATVRKYKVKGNLWRHFLSLYYHDRVILNILSTLRFDIE